MIERESNIVEGDLSKGVEVKIAADYFAEGYQPQPRRSSSYKKDVVTSATYRQAALMASNKLEAKSDTASQRIATEVQSIGFSKSLVDTHSSPTELSQKEETKEETKQEQPHDLLIPEQNQEPQTFHDQQ